MAALTSRCSKALLSPSRGLGTSDDGVTPLDSANQIAIPEFDGRIITGAVHSRISRRRPSALRRRRRATAGSPVSAVSHARCVASRRQQRVALMLSPIRRSTRAGMPSASIPFRRPALRRCKSGLHSAAQRLTDLLAMEDYQPLATR